MTSCAGKALGGARKNNRSFYLLAVLSKIYRC